jgi:hypothetical protein
MSNNVREYGRSILEADHPVGATTFWVIEIQLQGDLKYISVLQDEDGVKDVGEILTAKEELVTLHGFSFDPDGWFVMNPVTHFFRKESIVRITCYPTMRHVTYEMPGSENAPS